MFATTIYNDNTELEQVRQSYRDTIPEELKSQCIWFNWKYQQTEPGKWTKVPKKPDGSWASSTNPKTWATFETALAAVDVKQPTTKSSSCGRLGLAFSMEGLAGYIGIDIDDCLDLTSGEFRTWPEAPIQPEEVYRLFDSQTRITPSKVGLRILIKSDVPKPDGCGKDYGARNPETDKQPGYEMYERGRFFTVTPDLFRNSGNTIQNRTAELLKFYAILYPAKENSKEAKSESDHLNLEDIIEFATDLVQGRIGNRDDVLFASAGVFLNSKWSDNDIDTALLEMCTQFGAEDASFDVRSRSRKAVAKVKTMRAITAKNSDPKKRVGWKHLSEHVKPEVIQKWCNRPGFRTWKSGPSIQTEHSLPPGFELCEDGLYYLTPPTKDKVKQGEDQTYTQHPPMWISDPIEIVAQTRTADGSEWGKQLTWTDKDGRDQEWTMPTGMLSGDGSPIREQLMTRGLMISPKRFAREHFLEYIIKSEPPKKIRSVTQTGWYEDCYVLPYETIGKTTEPVVLQTVAQANSETYSSKGTLSDWQAKISLHCVGNSRLVFAVSAAFAGPILRLINEQGGGFHYKGLTSIGKSTGLFAGASVWGSPRFRGTWRTTSNGLESTAALHNDSLLILDEIDEVEANDAGPMIYMLANGQGKQRMTRNATLRKPYVWRLIFLSSGETSLSDHMHTVGKKTKGGQEVRCLEIPANANVGLGAFEDIHDFTDPALFSDTIQKSCEENYGVAGREFVRKICENLQLVKEKAVKGVAKFIKENRPEGASEEVGRACKKFAVVAVAGEIATQLEITGWLPFPDESWNAAKKCFKAWLDARGGAGSSDTQNGIRQVRRFLEAHGTSRFEVLDIDEPKLMVRDRVGFREQIKEDGKMVWSYYFLPEQFREVCKGYDPIAIAKALAERKMLIRDGASLQARRGLNGMGSERKRVYHLNYAQNCPPSAYGSRDLTV